jgi:hypothetical protein
MWKRQFVLRAVKKKKETLKLCGQNTELLNGKFGGG